MLSPHAIDRCRFLLIATGGSHLFPSVPICSHLFLRSHLFQSDPIHALQGTHTVFLYILSSHAVFTGPAHCLRAMARGAAGADMVDCSELRVYASRLHTYCYAEHITEW